ncbi:hypothetical protein AB1Y20_023241 [Prymnesium parvum]|uniref:DUF4110 domain-containing protein n=1 Tax=Prymnesium parvum TaxID=97485 RepID=A0AB34JFP1_PRYPA|mmetsp:Transcript_45378/g.112830  ORF Transcript_45378/g.112830 Transcript_45378/m.112830 type:complete len:580 (+) Transcript_45378:23-1762(+)
MGKRDTKAAKAKRAERRGKGSLKTDDKTEKSMAKKERKALNQKDENELQAILDEFQAMQASQVDVKEEVVPPPSPRCNCTLTAHPSRDELFLLGGEHYDGKKNCFYADLYRYSIKRNEWKRVISPAAPPPRSSHQTVAVPSQGGTLFVFGGEFSSANQMQFHHYRDFWSLDLTSMQWEQVQAKNGPSARSGHRMVHVRDCLVLFGGFFDNLREVKYYNDCYIFDLSLYKWSRVTPEPNAAVPSPRSGFQMVADPGSAGGGVVILYGGYFKKKVVMQQFDVHKDKSEVDELSETGVEYRDLWLFDVESKRWDLMKKSGTPPSSRSGFCLALNRRRLVVFGGVHDEDTEDGEGLVSEFYNDLHGYALDVGKWHSLRVSGKKASKPSAKAEGQAAAKTEEPASDVAVLAGGRRRNRNRHDGSDDELAGGFSASKAKGQSDDDMEGPPYQGGEAGPAGEGGSSVGEAGSEPMPPPRMNAAAALRGNMWYIYGGLVEPEDGAELTLNDLWAIDLAKLDRWHCLQEGEKHDVALVRDEESDNDSEDSGEEGDSDSDSSDDEEELAKSSDRLKLSDEGEDKWKATQ